MPFKRPFDELRTIKALLVLAERLAQDSGEELPGAEHLLLSAIALPDATAGMAFDRLGIDPDGLPAAIAAQHAEALRTVGIEAGGVATPPEPVPPGRGVFHATSSAQAVFRRAVELSGTTKPRRLLGAHVVLAVTEMEHGTAVRALRRMGVDRAQLADAAHEVLSRFHA
jgi:ATP-dependent Clp protease ATP-binding subunit ClpA